MARFTFLTPWYNVAGCLCRWTLIPSPFLALSRCCGRPFFGQWNLVGLSQIDPCMFGAVLWQVGPWASSSVDPWKALKWTPIWTLELVAIGWCHCVSAWMSIRPLVWVVVLVSGGMSGTFVGLRHPLATVERGSEGGKTWPKGARMEKNLPYGIRL